ncbi:hypothetical protein BJ508DRAFT_86288 [Ascobolus immersus RN42]|uniref:Uncharacterized protein n=1 Tax=Ascobolus immersus RN42 TaxID=1160509 RepID=A0A3N4I952_ASCIM|nr:hypothetical protein BJ508DRAFT_86288 [Ascobolus immersus RN42]
MTRLSLSLFCLYMGREDVADLWMDRGKYTLEISALTFYFHGSNTPTLPVAESQEILSLLRPEPDQIADTMARVMMLCVVLREEQEGIVRALQKISEQTGVDLSLEGSAEEEQAPRREKKVGLAEKIDGLVAAMQRLKEEFVVKSELEALKEEVGERSASRGAETDRGTTRDRETTTTATATDRDTPREETEEQEQENEYDEEYEEEVVQPKPKKRRKSTFSVDLTRHTQTPEIPDSQPVGRHNTGGRRTSGRSGRHLK